MRWTLSRSVPGLLPRIVGAFPCSIASRRFPLESWTLVRSRIKAVVFACLVVAFCVPFAAQPAGAQTVPTCAGKRATIVGTAGADVLKGTPRADVIVGNGGDDRILGGGGNDTICGNAGADYVQGGDGADLIIGGYGNDRLIGSNGNDDIRGGIGNDYISGKAGRDTIRGDQGADRIAGNLGVDTCTVQNIDVQITSCDRGNLVQSRGTGDGVGKLALPNSFSVARHCFALSTRCDDYFVARVDLDGAGSFDALGIQAFDVQGKTIANFGGVGDTFEGAFLFKGKPTTIEVDSGGGNWAITFVDRTGVPFKRASTTGSGNEVYRISNKVKRFTTARASWNSFGNFAVIGVSPSTGRDLMVNEVRFAGRNTPPFTTAATAKSGISVVQVLSGSRTWSFRLGS